MKVVIVKSFKLNRDDGSVAEYGIGEHDMPDVDAKHWFTRLFVEPAKDEPVKTKAPKEEK